MNTENEFTNDEIDYLSRVPTCPFCNSEIKTASSDYSYRRTYPDCRWFWCESCQAHLGRHRMKGTWIVDPYDLQNLQEKGYLVKQ